MFKCYVSKVKKGFKTLIEKFNVNKPDILVCATLVQE